MKKSEITKLYYSKDGWQPPPKPLPRIPGGVLRKTSCREASPEVRPFTLLNTIFAIEG